MKNADANTTETAAVGAQAATVAPEKATSKKGASKKAAAPKGTSKPKGKKAAKGNVKAPPPKKQAKAAKKADSGNKVDTARVNKKAEVIELMRRPKGVTAAEIMELTQWQAHTVRGFVSILGSKGGHTIESTKTAAGERNYRITK